jgi:hypothetical protein
MADHIQSKMAAGQANQVYTQSAGEWIHYQFSEGVVLVVYDPATSRGACALSHSTQADPGWLDRVLLTRRRSAPESHQAETIASEILNRRV